MSRFRDVYNVIKLVADFKWPVHQYKIVSTRDCGLFCHHVAINSPEFLFYMMRGYARWGMKELRVKERWASNTQKRSNGEIEAD